MWKAPKSRWIQRPPALPEGLRFYVIGDIHGRADLLATTLACIDSDRARHSVARVVHVFLGDYVDRGPASRGVIDILMARGSACESVFLKGNHEAYLLEFLEDPRVLEEWREYGGLTTLLSYGMTPPLNPDAEECAALSMLFRSTLPASHRLWFGRLQNSFSCGDFFFAHAGVRPGVPLAQQREEDLLWIRNDFLLWDQDFDKMIVHGHTPVAEPEIRANRINIDTGAYATGRLTCLILERAEMHLL